VVHPNRKTLPKGQIFHAAGPSTGGWTIVAVHDSKESWEHFRDGILMPQMKKGIPGGLAGPPQETGIEVHNLPRHLPLRLPWFSWAFLTEAPGEMRAIGQEE
jgi:hypothetical protein